MLVKFYKIINNQDDTIYIGSTIQPLYKRINEHRKRFRNKNLNQYSSSILFDKYGIENCKIILIDEIWVNHKEERNKIEQNYIDEFKDFCVNKYYVFKTDEVIKEQKNKYYQTRWDKNKEKILLEKSKEYICEICNCKMRQDNIGRHNKSIKHNTALEYVKKK